MSRWSALLCWVLSAGCATSAHVVELEPLTFQARQTRDGYTVDTLDPEILFDEASKAYKAQRYEMAAEKYEVFLEAFGEHAHARLALFNAGLSREKMGEWERAAQHFRRYLDGANEPKDRIDGLFRVSVCLHSLKKWEALGQALDQLLDLPLVDADRIEAWMLRGVAHKGMGQLAHAERALGKAIAVARGFETQEVLAGSQSVARAHFEIGDIYQALFEEIRFVLPVERMRRDLHDKSKLFLKSQAAYLRAIRVHHPRWAAAAGYRVGEVYESFYRDLLEAEVPTDLEEEEVQLYFSELKDQIRPLIERAVQIYERNLKMSQRSDRGGDEWIEKTRERLEKLRRLIREEEMRRRREKEGTPSGQSPSS